MPPNNSGERIRSRRPTPPSIRFDSPPALEFTGAAYRHSRRGRPGLAVLAASASLLATAGPAAAMTASQVAQQPLLSQGSSGSAVTQLQRSLHIDPTGHFTAATRSAVEHFQSSHDISVDGIVGPQTRDALDGIKPPSVAATDTATDAGSGGYTIPAGIVQCESGGDYGAVNAQSGAGGAYQILPSTWAAYGGQGLPQDASPAEQGQIAARIYASQGPGAWTC
jgi:peptidoglycan hydrolase-like protein with peptidoglycan-binding domain